jgi:hypothetical protein
VNPTTSTWIIFALLTFVFVRNLRGFLLFLFPGRVRYDVVAQDVATTDPALRTMFRELEELGFSPVGRVVESRPLSPKVEQSVFANQAGELAMVFPRQREAWLSVVSTPGDVVVWTADHVFPSQEGRGFVTGGLPGASPQGVLAAHRRRAARPTGDAAAGSPRLGDGALKAYIDAATLLHGRGPSKGEVRRGATRGFFFAAAALGWGAMTAWKWMKG